MQLKESRSAATGQKPGGAPPWALFTPEEVKAAHGCLREAYSRGDLRRERYKHILEALKFVDEHGRVWSIGRQSGSWYYNFNFEWHPGEPYSMLTRMDSVSPTCLHCGSDTPSRLAVYCIMCGRPLSSLPEKATIVPEACPAPPPEGLLRRRLVLAGLVLALLAVALLVYMYVSGTMLYAGFADPVLPTALAAPFLG